MAQARFDRGAAPESMATGRMILTLERSAAQQQALAQYLDDVQNPASSSYHQWLTPTQYGARYGISDADLQTVETWLQSYGFRIEKVPAARNALEFSGTAGQVQTAFRTSIHAFSVLGATHYANVTDPQIPAALTPVVAGVGPLNDFHPQAHLVQGTSGSWDATSHTIQPNLTLFSGTTPLLFVDPADAATIYDAPNTNLNANFTGTTYDGTGVNIGIVGVSDLTLADVANYRMAFLGETSTTLNSPTVIVEGDDPGLNGAGVEALLDAEVSGGLAPRAKLYYYTSADTDLTSGLFNAIVRAIDDNAVSILSMSFGQCEAGLGTSGNAFMLEEAQQAAAQGISFVVSAGDGGSAGCDNFDTETQAQFGLAVSGLASTPWTTAVGGTDFDALPGAFATYANATSNGTAPYYRTALKYIPENPWNDSTSVNTTVASDVRFINSQGQGNIVAGSGGVSSVYGKPAFQSSLTPADSARDVPDVSFFASNGFKQAVWAICSDNVTDGNLGQTYTDCQTSGGQLAAGTQIGGVGGTSASTPAFAGMLALLAQSQGGARLGQVNTALYQLAKSKYATVFHDVTVGNNAVPCATSSLNCGANGFLTGYNTGTGYDLATGLGSVDIKQMITNWSSVALTATSTTLTIDGSTAAYTGVHGASLTFNVGVTPTAATGAVAVIDTANETAGGTANGPQNNGQVSIPLASGAGTTTYNGLPGGTYTVTARYSGDTSDASSGSTPINVTISAEPSTTTLAVSAYNPLTGNGVSSSSAPYGSEVFLDARIEGTAEGANTEGTATGTVTFANGTTTLGTASVTASGNLASWPPRSSKFVALSPGAYSVTAGYSGDASYKISTSAPASFTITPAVTTMTANDSGSTVSIGNFVTANVTVTTAFNAGAAPTGSATITGNGNTIGTITLYPTIETITSTDIVYLLNGSGLFNGSQLAPGNNVVTLAYSGDANYASSSTTLNIYNTSGVGAFTLSNSGNVTLTAGQSANFTVTVTPAGGFTSPVGLNCSSALCGGGSVNVSGTSPIAVPMTINTGFTTAPGTYTVTVTGVNDTGKITASTSFTVTVNSIPANAGITLSNNGPISVAAGSTQNNFATITATPTNGYIGTLIVTCSVTGSPAGATNPATCADPTDTLSISGTTAVTKNEAVTTGTTTTQGAYTLSVTATDISTASITSTTTFTVNVTAPSVPQAIALSSGGAITVNPGATTANTSTISVMPSGGFTGAVNLSCALTGSPTGASNVPTCGVPASIMISGTTAATATLTVYTTAATSGALNLPLQKFFAAGGGAVLALVLFVGIPARRKAWRTVFSVVALVVLVGAVGCGGGGGGGGGGGSGGGGTPGTTPGAYTVTVTGTDAATGKITSSVAVPVTVN